jgi:hypothetical protein
MFPRRITALSTSETVARVSSGKTRRHGITTTPIIGWGCLV